MSDKEVNIADIIDTARTESPSDFQNAFNTLMMDKARAAVDAYKAQLAQQYFNNEQSDQESESSDVSDESTEEDETDEDTESSTEDEG